MPQMFFLSPDSREEKQEVGGEKKPQPSFARNESKKGKGRCCMLRDAKYVIRACEQQLRPHGAINEVSGFPSACVRVCARVCACVHVSSKQPRIGTPALRHSLIRLFVRSHRSLICLFVRWLTLKLAPHCSLCCTQSLVRSLTHSQAREKEKDFMSQNHAVLTHRGVRARVCVSWRSRAVKLVVRGAHVQEETHTKSCDTKPCDFYGSV